jgi:hypothetical protein
MAGFHNDRNLMKVVDFFAKTADVFIETGTNIGNTMHHMLSKYPALKCFSCEPDPKRFKKSVARLKSFENSQVFNTTSQKFIRYLHRNRRDVLNMDSVIWLDAHSKLFEWPLKDEITYFTKYLSTGIILIDDFKVPGQKQFQFNRHGKQPYSFEYISRFIDPMCKFKLYYPKYKESSIKRLVGWGLLQIGKPEVHLDKVLPRLVKR